MKTRHLLLIYSFGLTFLIIRLIFGLETPDRPLLTSQTFSGRKPVKNSDLVTYYTNFLPSHEAALVTGTLFGQKADITNHQKRLLANAGLTHVIVASGMNLVFLIGLLDFFCLKIESKRVKVIIRLGAVIFYCFLTGFEPPIVRAGIMSLSVGLSGLIGRPKMAYWGLILTASLLLLFSPQIIASISFQLSFLATTAQIYLGRLQGHVPILSNYILIPFWQTIFVQLFTLPIILANFGIYPGGAIVANFFTLWTVPWIMSLGLVAGIIGLASNVIGKIVILPVHALTYYFWKVVEIIGSQESVLIKVGSIDLTICVIYYVSLFVIILWSERQVTRLINYRHLD